MPEMAERAAAEERKMAADQAFAEKLAKRLPPDAVEHAAIKKARRRTKARAPRVATRIDGHEMYSPHSDVEGHLCRLADAFGTRSKHFVYSMLKGLGKATEDHSEDHGFYPGSADEVAFNAAWAVIDGCGRGTRLKRCWRPTWLSRTLPCSNWSPACVAPPRPHVPR